MRAVSAMPQAPCGSTPINPHPRVAPSALREAGSIGVCHARCPWIHVPAYPPISTACGGASTPASRRMVPIVAEPVSSTTEPGVGDGAGECEELRPRTRRGPGLAPPLGSGAQDRCDVRRRLGVRHDGRMARRATPGERCRGEQRQRHALVQVARHRARPHPRRSRPDRTTAATPGHRPGSRARAARCAGPGTGLDRASVEVDHHLPRTQDLGDRRRTLEHRVGPVRADGPVLAARRLALAAVDDQHRVPGRRQRGLQLAPQREAAPAAALQATGPDLREDLLTAQQRRRPEPVHVGLERLGALCRPRSGEQEPVRIPDPRQRVAAPAASSCSVAST